MRDTRGEYTTVVLEREQVVEHLQRGIARVTAELQALQVMLADYLGKEKQ